MFKYIYFCFILLFTSSSPCCKDQFAVSYLSTILIGLIQVCNWEIRHHSLICCCGLADILYILEPFYLPIELPTYIPTFPTTYPPTYLPTRLPTYLPIPTPTYLFTYLPSYLPTHPPFYQPTYLPTYLPTNEIFVTERSCAILISKVEEDSHIG